MRYAILALIAYASSLLFYCIGLAKTATSSQQSKNKSFKIKSKSLYSPMKANLPFLPLPAREDMTASNDTALEIDDEEGKRHRLRN